MIKIPSLTSDKYDDRSDSNPSLITAGFPSGSIMASSFNQRSPTLKQHHHVNQNRATDTQPISLDSQKDDHSQYTILSHRTMSDTYLNLSRKDINDVMTALHTLAEYVQNDVNHSNEQHRNPIDDKESDHLTMLYSKSTNRTFQCSNYENSSSHPRYYYPRYAIRNRRRHSLSSDRWFHHQHHHIKHHFSLVGDFQHDLYDMKRKQERRILRQLHNYQKYFNHQISSDYPSYSSNAILYTSTCEANIRSRKTDQCSEQHPSTIKIPSEDRYQQSINKPFLSSIPLSSSILDQFVYIDQKEPFPNIQMAPQQAHTLQILQNNQIHRFISIDSLNTKDILRSEIKPCHSQKLNLNETSGTGDYRNLNKIDVATQWSLQIQSLKHIEPNICKSHSTLIGQDEPEYLDLHLTRTNSTLLTELSQSITTFATHNSLINEPLMSKTQLVANNSSFINNPCNIQLNENTDDMYLEKSSLPMNDNHHDLTKSETERFLITLNLPTCQCSTTKPENVKHLSTDDTITSVSLNNKSSSSLLNKKKTKQIPTKAGSKRPHHHTSKSSKNNQRIKRSRLHCRSQFNNRSMTVIQSYPTTDPKEDSSFDFFDIDTTFTDPYDRLFTDMTTSEKSS